MMSDGFWDWGWLVAAMYVAGSSVQAQQLDVSTPLLSQSRFDKVSEAIVKLVSDEGERTGAGVIVGVLEDGAALILTSHSMVAGRDKLAVILRNNPNALLGTVVKEWIDGDLELAVLKVTNFPFGRNPVVFKNNRTGLIGGRYSIIGHTSNKDWDPVQTRVTDENEGHLVCTIGGYSGIAGAPLVDQDGNMIGLIVSDAVEESQTDHLTLAVKTNFIEPILDEWFKQVDIDTKWRRKRPGLVTWLWAVGGGVVGGTVAAVIALGGGDSGSPRGLPRPPAPPDVP